MKRNIAVIAASGLLFIAVMVFLRNFSENEYSQGIFLNGEKIGEKEQFILYNDKYYISLDLLTENGLLDGYTDESGKNIIIYHDYMQYVEPVDKNSKILLLSGKIYIDSEFTKEKYNIPVFQEENENIISIETNYNIYITKTKIPIRKETRVNSDITGHIPAGERVKVFYSNEKYSRVKWKENFGYIRTDNVFALKTSLEAYEVNNMNRKEIVLAWDHFTSRMKEFKPQNHTLYEPVNTVSPTFYRLDSNSSFDDISNSEYTDHCRNLGISVWPSFTNSFNPELTSSVLKDFDSRSKIISEIAEICSNNNYEGINIDFENIYLADKNKYSKFIMELYTVMKKKNIKMSVDISCISESENWSKCFDRKTIGKYSDYIVLMAYDERTQPEHGPGSVSSLPWVEENVKKLIEFSCREKIILGVPFYTRLWETDRISGKVSTTALRISTMKEYIDEKDFKISYDAENRQNYAEKKDEHTFSQIWIEDEISLANRIQLIKKYKLNGIAVWCNNYSQRDMWEVIEESFNMQKK